MREPEKILTPLFVDLLNEAVEDKRLVVMFDVFERTASTLSSWLIDLFSGKHGDISSYVSFTLSGRDPLEQHWTELAGLMTHLQLEPFTPEETAVYLSNQGITDEALANQIHEDTGGLPVLVQLLASTNPQPGTALPDISKDAVERFLQWTPDDAKRHAALLAATPRQFNQEILQALLGGEQGKALFHWLAEQSFIRSNGERGYFYHDKVRALMLRHQKNTTPKELAQIHTALAEYFAKAQADLGLQGKEVYESQGWRNLELERVYHHFSAAPEKHFAQVLDSFLTAFTYRWRFSGELVRAAQQAGHDSQSGLLNDNLEKLENLVDFFDKDKYKEVLEILNGLQEVNGLSTSSQSFYFFRRGYCHYRLVEYEEARKHFDHAIELNEKLTRAFAHRGDIYKLTERYEEALADCTRAVELDEKYDWAFAVRGHTYISMGRYEEALADFTRAIDLDEKYKWAIAQRGETYKLMERYEEALVDFTRAIELDDKYSWAVASRGVTYRLMKQYDNAMQDLTHAIELDEKNASIFFQRGETYRLMDRYEEALVDFTRTIELDEKYAWAFAQRGETFRLMKRYEEALVDFTRDIELDEKYAWVFVQRGETYKLTERYEEALVDFTRAIELDEKYTWAFAIRGNAYRLMGNYQEALQDLTRAIELDEKYAWAFSNRGLTYCLTGKYDEALQDFTHAIDLNEKYFWAYAWRGETFRRVGKYDLALLDLTKVVQEGDDPCLDDVAIRASVYTSLGDIEAAQKDIEQVLSSECKKPVDHYGRGLALILSNRILESFTEFEIAFADSFFRARSHTDNLLDPIRDLPEFKALLAKYE